MTLLSPPAGLAKPLSPRTTPPTFIARQSVSAPGRTGQHDIARSARAAIRLILASIAVLAVLQLISLPSLDPLRGTISGMVYAPGGNLLFVAMGALCVTGSAMLATSLARLGARKAAAAVGVWCLALAVAAVVPTDPPGVAVASLAAEIHRDAAAVMFAAMPLAGLLVAAYRFHGSAGPSASQRALRRASVAAALVGLLQLAVSIPSLFPDTAIASWPAVRTLYSVRGLAERALFVALLVVLVRVGAVASHCSVAHTATRPGRLVARGRTLSRRGGTPLRIAPRRRPRPSTRRPRGSYAAGTATRMANRLASRAAERADSSKSGARHAKRVRPSAPPSAQA